MQNKRNYYRILHVQPDAPVELIRTSYRTIMQKLKKHPDLGGDEWDAAVINEAYSVLCDDKLRAAYDKRLLRERTMADTGAQSETQRDKKQGDHKQGNSKQGDNKHEDAKQSDNTKAKSEKKESAQEQKTHTQRNSANDNCCLFCGLGYDGVALEDRDCVACTSPLMPVDPKIIERNTQRGIQRQPNYCPLEIVAFWPGERQAAVLADLSPNGLKFRFNQALQAGHLLKIDCALFTGVAKVAYCEESDSAFLLGAKFLSIRFATQQGTFVSTSA